MENVDRPLIGEVDPAMMQVRVEPMNTISASAVVSNPSAAYQVRERLGAAAGRPVARGITHVEDALQQLNLNYEVETRRIQVVNGAVIPNHFANVRTDTNVTLGVVGKDYKVIQNAEGFKITEDIMANGALELVGGGEFYRSDRTLRSVYLEGKTHPFTILGDKIEPYILFRNSFDGSTKLQIVLTPYRVYCWNTLTAAIRGARRIWEVKHTTEAQGRVEEAQRTLGLIEKYNTALPAFAERMNEIPIDKKEIELVLDYVFPVDADDGKRAAERKDAYRRKIDQILNTTEDLKKFKGTGWGLYNAFADFVAHEPPARKTEHWQMNRFEEVALGAPVLMKAQAAIQAIPA